MLDNFWGIFVKFFQDGLPYRADIERVIAFSEFPDSFNLNCFCYCPNYMVGGDLFGGIEIYFASSVELMLK